MQLAEEIDVLFDSTSLLATMISAACSRSKRTVINTDTQGAYGAQFSPVTHGELPRGVVVAGLPQLVFSRGPFVDLLVRWGVNTYHEFKALDSTYVVDAAGECMRVPASKGDIFQSKSLSLVEKRLLMRFLTDCMEFSEKQQQQQQQPQQQQQHHHQQQPIPHMYMQGYPGNHNPYAAPLGYHIR
eukprot:comp16767_c0_seq1/m.27254 comp16767_c0_seq1/g.27254  ORF comp16767_c0_seq1/g.27254 comp16767_c0_seq1/m.27254 type:complete len:185 (-) comp16767_c0_seq1:54-608(-)